jgi:hypothetical protein
MLVGGYAESALLQLVKRHRPPYRSGSHRAKWCRTGLTLAQSCEEARSIAGQMSDPEAKRVMLRIAQDCEQLAARVEF